MKTNLKPVRKSMLVRDLKRGIDLPDYDDNQLVEVSIHPTAKEEKKPLSKAEIKALLDSLTGCLKGADPNKTLDDWRKERLEERYDIKLAD